MAITRGELQVQWSAANSLSIASGASSNSDAFTLTTEAFQASVQIKADNDGTPASGDTVDFFLLGTTGDPDGTGSDEYASNSHGLYLGRVDTFIEDPAIMVVDIPPSAKGGKVRAANNSAGRAITVSACINEVRG